MQGLALGVRSAFGQLQVRLSTRNVLVDSRQLGSSERQVLQLYWFARILSVNRLPRFDQVRGQAFAGSRALESDSTALNQTRRLFVWWGHDLFRKPVPTFRDHALMPLNRELKIRFLTEERKFLMSKRRYDHAAWNSIVGRRTQSLGARLSNRFDRRAGASKGRAPGGHLPVFFCSFRFSDAQRDRPGTQYDRDKKQSVRGRDEIHAPMGAFEQSDGTGDTDEIGHTIGDRAGRPHTGAMTCDPIFIVIAVGGGERNA